MLTDAEVYAVVRLIPHGHVLSYSGVARLCGYPRNARQVGQALANLRAADMRKPVPWWRVVNAAGRISNPYGPEEQRRRLEAEGVAVSPELRVSLRRHDGEEMVYGALRLRKR
jgi:methylated-DNA-protein-cysteine methyltransferase related protein